MVKYNKMEVIILTDTGIYYIMVNFRKALVLYLKGKGLLHYYT